MKLMLSAWIVAFFTLAACDQSAVVHPAADGPEVAGRWISVGVNNEGEPDHHLSVVDERDLTRVVGVANPATIPGHTTMRARLFVPDDIPWMVKSNDLLLLGAGDVQGFCGTLPVTLHLNWGAGTVEVPIWMGEAVGFPGRPPDNCDASDREVLRLPGAP